MFCDVRMTDSDLVRAYGEDGEGSARTRIESAVIGLTYDNPTIVTPDSDSEQEDSDTVRAFREDGEGSARTHM